jgi:class 3 adenylate cyclase
MERRLSAILAADVVGYSALMEQDEAGTFDRLRSRRIELFEPEIARHHGLARFGPLRLAFSYPTKKRAQWPAFLRSRDLPGAGSFMVTWPSTGTNNRRWGWGISRTICPDLPARPYRAMFGK